MPSSCPTWFPPLSRVRQQAEVRALSLPPVDELGLEGETKLGRMKAFFQRMTLVLALLVSLFSIAVSAGQRNAFAAGTGPCDIYATGGTPCVAAHSTTRALFGAYSGRLYQVRRASDGATTDIGTLAAGGFANAGTQDSFCAGTTCLITVIYDQTSRGNNLTQ